MEKLNRGIWAGIALFIFCLIILIHSFQYSYKGDVGPGPGFFPIWLSAILLVLSVLFIVETVKGKNVSEEPLPSKDAFLKTLYILGCLVLFTILFTLFGFIWAGIVLLFLLLYKSYKWYISAAISIGVPFFLYWLFSMTLGLPIPLEGAIF